MRGGCWRVAENLDVVIGCFVGLLCQDAPPGCFVGLLCRVALRGSVRLCGGLECEVWAMWCSCCLLPFLVFLN